MIHICLDPVSNGCFGNSRDNRVKDISEVRERTEQYIATGWYFRVLRCHLTWLPIATDSQVVGREWGCQTQLLEGHGPAVFSSNPAPIHLPVVFKKS